ncbi:MAG: sulfatase [Acidobacteriota bacterium]|nr:sulfatase [Acidobacteriota bacterium]
MSPPRFSWTFTVFALGACAPDGARLEIDLRAELSSAAVSQTPPMLDLGTAEGQLHLLQGWSEGATRSDGVTYAWSVGPRSTFSFFLDQPQDLDLRFIGRPFHLSDEDEQQVHVEVNGVGVDSFVPRTSGRGTAVAVPAAALRSGTNEVALTYAYTAIPATLGRGPDERELAVAWHRISIEGPPLAREIRLEGEEMRLPFGTRVDYFIDLPDRATLMFERLKPGGADSGSLHLEILSVDGSSRAATVAVPSGRVAPLEDLPAGPARLRLVARNEAGSHGDIRLESPRVGGVATKRHESPPTPAITATRTTLPHVLFYLVDTLRADHLSCYGYARETSPHLDAFAADATLFENAFAAASKTRPSIASLFTGLSPFEHGVNGGYDRLPDEAVTIAELLRGAGYTTVGFIANPTIADELGFGQGFEHYTLTGKAKDTHPTPMAELLTNWLDTRDGSAPFFAYIHAIEPHGPYQPPAQLRERFGAVPGMPFGSSEHLKTLQEGAVPPAEGEASDLQKLYDAEISWSDQRFAQVVELLREHDLYDETIIVFVSDHGEAFFEHGWWQHGRVLYREVVGVPLVVRFPELGHGLRVAQPVQLTDLLPTILEAAGVPVPAGAVGRDLVPLLEAGAQDIARRHYSLAMSGGGHVSASVTTQRWRLIESAPSGSAQSHELYEWREDPAERTDLAADHPVITGYLRTLLAKRREETASRRLDRETIELSPAIEERLRALGYLN